MERTIREHYAQGIRHFFITDDNLARNKDWEAIFDRIIALREGENMNIRLMVQVDTLCHKIPNFIEKAARAGTNRVLVGLESINAANLLAAKKRQNKLTEYRAMLLAWKNAGAITTAGYILGFPFDTPESIREDIAIIQNELPLDILGSSLRSVNGPPDPALPSRARLGSRVHDNLPSALATCPDHAPERTRCQTRCQGPGSPGSPSDF